PRGVDVGEARLGEDGGERQVPLQCTRRTRDDEHLLHLHRRGVRAAGRILVVGQPVAVVIRTVAADLRWRERGGRRPGDRGRRRAGDGGRRRLGDRSGRRGDGRRRDVDRGRRRGGGRGSRSGDRGRRGGRGRGND